MLNRIPRVPRVTHTAPISAVVGGVCALIFLGPSALWAKQPAAQAPANVVERLETIIVTAQKRPESLRDAPVAVTVLGSGHLAAANASQLSDLNTLVPAVEFTGSLDDRPPLGIRGISSVARVSAVGLASGVEIAIDGVPVPWDSYAANQLEDVRSIEVLEGPQSTLGGRTASAGEINILTHDPSDKWTGSLDTTVTSDNEEHLQAYLAGPIDHDLSFSTFVWGHSVQFPTLNLYNGKHTRMQDTGGRAKLRWRPTASLDVLLSLRYSVYQAFGNPYVYTYLTPGQNCMYVGRRYPPCSPSFPTSQQNLLPNITPSLSNLNYASQLVNSGAIAHDVDGMLNVSYSFGDGYKLTSTTDFQREIQRNTQDLFVTGVPSFNALTGCGCWNDAQLLHENIRQVVEELKLLSPASGPFNYILGMFYSDTRVHSTTYRPMPAVFVDTAITPDTATYDLYGRATQKIFAHTKIFGGLRFNYDHLSYDYVQTMQLGQIPFECAYCSSHGANGSTALVGDVGVQQKLADGTRLYFKYERGYAPKAYDTTAVLYCSDYASYGGSFPEKCPGTGPYTSAAPLTPVAQEHINDFEVGSKGTYFHNRLSVNADAFYTKYSNYQLQVLSNITGVLEPPGELSAAGGVETKGVELDALAAPTATSTIGFSGAYVDARFTRYPNAPCWVGQTVAQGCVVSGIQAIQNVSGSSLPFAPAFKGVISGSKTIRLRKMPFDLHLSANYSYTTSAQMQADQNPATVQPGFGLLNVAVGFISRSGDYSVTLFVNNVTDHHYYTTLADFWAAPWGANAVVGEPARGAVRYAGIRLHLSF